MTSTSAIGSIENDTPVVSISLVVMIIYIYLIKKRITKDKDYHIYKKRKQKW
jgi:hypothetical protein